MMPMHWATRIFSKDGWYDVQDQFEATYEAAGRPVDMMLVYREMPDFRMHLFVGMPDMPRLEAFAGFEAVEQLEPPARPKLLMGDPDEFALLFTARGGRGSRAGSA